MSETIAIEDQNEINKVLLITAAAEGDLELIKRLLFECKVDINVFVRNNIYAKRQTTPLLAAAMNDQRDVIRFLLENGANIWNWNDSSATSLSNNNNSSLSGYLSGSDFLNEEVMRLHRDPYRILCDLATGMHPIHFAAVNGDVNSITLMLDLFETQKRQHRNQENKDTNVSTNKRKVSLVDVPDDFGLTPLHWAAWAGQLEVMKVLIERGASPHSCSNHFKMSRGVRKLTPLHMCCMLGNTTVIIKNVSQNYSDFLTFISLRNEKHYENDNQAERSSKYLPCVKFLVELGVDILALNGRRMTPLHYCVNESNVEIFDFLLASLINKCNTQPRDAAVEHVIELLAGLNSLRRSEQNEESLLDICEQKQLLSKSVVLRDLNLDAIKAKLQKKNEEIQKSLEEANTSCSCLRISCLFCSVSLKKCQLEDHLNVCSRKTLRQCMNSGYGCTFTGAGITYFRHLVECPFSSVVCSLCFQLFPRNKICLHYQETHFITKDMYRKTQRKCLLKEFGCPNMLFSADLENHILNCEVNLVRCPSCRIICQWKEISEGSHICIRRQVTYVSPEFICPQNIFQTQNQEEV